MTPLASAASHDSSLMSVSGSSEGQLESHLSVARLFEQGCPRAIFQYLPLTTRLTTMFENKTTATMLEYRQRRTVEDDVLHDVFDGDCYAALTQRQVVWEGQLYPDRYFSASTDVALQLGLDGVQCFERNGIDCWPIIITLYSLSPELRHRQEYQICCGIIAGEPTKGNTWGRSSN